jgi:hypothetical protein
MASCTRLMIKLAAIGIATMLSTAAPAQAAEGAATAREPAAAITNATAAVIKRDASRGTRISASQNTRRASPIRSKLDCSGAWCGRQFVLMIGVGY